MRQVYALAAAACERLGEEFPETFDDASELIEHLRLENGHPSPFLGDTPRRRRQRTSRRAEEAWPKGFAKPGCPGARATSRDVACDVHAGGELEGGTGAQRGSHSSGAQRSHLPSLSGRPGPGVLRERVGEPRFPLGGLASGREAESLPSGASRPVPRPRGHARFTGLDGRPPGRSGPLPKKLRGETFRAVKTARKRAGIRAAATKGSQAPPVLADTAAMPTNRAAFNELWQTVCDLSPTVQTDDDELARIAQTLTVAPAADPEERAWALNALAAALATLGHPGEALAVLRAAVRLDASPEARVASLACAAVIRARPGRARGRRPARAHGRGRLG